MDDLLLETLLHENEGPALDFKRDQYPFVKGSDDEKGELLKDILTFANAWRRETAYILVGVDEVPGGRSTPVGVAQHLSDHELQQFVNSKTQRAITFRYLAYAFRGVQLGVIEIPVQPRPFYLIKDYGRLKKDAVYIRRGSSMAIATPDEVAQIGAAAQALANNYPTFDLQLLDWRSQEPIGTTATLVTGILDSSQLRRPVAPGHYLGALTDHFVKTDAELFDEVVRYVRESSYLEPIGFWLQNSSSEAAKTVVASIRAPKASGLRVSVTAPIEPSRARMPYVAGGLIDRLRKGQDPDPSVDERMDYWRITIPFGSLNPKSEVLSTSPIWVGADAPCVVELETRIAAENLPNPAEGILKVVIEPRPRQMTVKEVDSLMRRA